MHRYRYPNHVKGLSLYGQYLFTILKQLILSSNSVSNNLSYIKAYDTNNTIYYFVAYKHYKFIIISIKNKKSKQWIS